MISFNVFFTDGLSVRLEIRIFHREAVGTASPAQAAASAASQPINDHDLNVLSYQFALALPIKCFIYTSLDFIRLSAYKTAKALSMQNGQLERATEDEETTASAVAIPRQNRTKANMEISSLK